MPVAKSQPLSANKVRTRFAPSPTGALHAGTVRTALFAWLTARHTGGDFILRIEDTDKGREVEGGIKNITESLKYLGLNWDEGPEVDGQHGPYIQSERLEIYKEWAEKLLKTGRAYADPYSPEEVDKFRKAAQAAKKPFLFRDHRPDKPPAWDGSQPLRFKSEPRTYNWADAVMGELASGPEVIDDFIILKSDGYPTYNFAHIIDDYLMEISHVIRSQEFISSVPNYMNLYEALEFKPPVMATVPNVLGDDGKRKLSKREGAKQLLDYQKMGILPEALMNALATTGWNDGTEQELFSKDELIKKFSLDRVQRSGAHFDERRMLWLNGHYIRELKPTQLAEQVEAFWPAAAKQADSKYRQQVLELVQERLKYLAELPKLTSFFFEEPDPKAVKDLLQNTVDKQLEKLSAIEQFDMLKIVRQKLGGSNFSEAVIQETLNDLLESLQTKPGILFALVRVAVTGSPVSPEIFGTLAVLGKDESLKRIDQAVSLLESLA